MIDTVLFDIDGVLADFVGPAMRLHGASEKDVEPCEWHLEKSLGITTQEFWKPIQQAGHGFWANLEPYSWKDDLIKLAGQRRWYLCTTPSLDPFCASGKVMWIKRHFGAFFRDYIITPHKHLLAGDSTLLVDDSLKNCDEFREAGGRACLFPQRWNDLDFFREPKDKLKWVLDCITFN